MVEVVRNGFAVGDLWIYILLGLGCIIGMTIFTMIAAAFQGVSEVGKGGLIFFGLIIAGVTVAVLIGYSKAPQWDETTPAINAYYGTDLTVDEVKRAADPNNADPVFITRDGEKIQVEIVLDGDKVLLQTVRIETVQSEELPPATP